MKRLTFFVLTLVALAIAPTAQAATPFTLHVPVLMYHRIQCADASTRLPGLFICPAALGAQMALLEAKGWHTITADELAQDVTDHVCPGPKTFVVTVDDGALDGYKNGADIWQAHGFRATFAMVTGKAGDYLLDPEPSWFSPLKPHFSYDQARDLVDRGFGIADHTVWHTAVANDSDAKMDVEVGAAQDQLKAELGFKPKVFVYPYGSFGTTETPYLADRFVLAFTDPGSTGAKTGADETTDPMHAPRIRVSRGESAASVLKAVSRFASPC